VRKNLVKESRCATVGVIRNDDVLTGFYQAVRAGDLSALTQVLSEEVTFWADGGGKVQTVPRPIYGQQAVARFWLSVARKSPRLLTYTPEEINGEPAMLCWNEGRLAGVLCLALSATGIQDVYALLNPDKLAYLQQQLATRK